MQIDRLASAAAALGTMVVLAGCGASTQRTTTVESGGEVASAVVTPANNRSIPVGAQLSATLDQTLGTERSKAGDVFTPRSRTR